MNNTETKQRVILNRDLSTNKGILGIMTLKGVEIARTYEMPDKDNQHFISCIPAGIYQVKPHNGKKFQGTWELLGVPDRTAILIHIGNTIRDTQGCILVGKEWHFFGNDPGVQGSKKCFMQLKTILDDYFELEITEPKNIKK